MTTANETYTTLRRGRKSPPTTSEHSVNNTYCEATPTTSTLKCEQDELFPPTVRNPDEAFTHYGIVQIGGIIVRTQWTA